MTEAWREILKFGPEVSDLVLMNKVGKIFTLPNIISDEILQLNDIDHDLYLGWREDLIQALYHINFRAQFNDFSSRLTDSLLMNIRFCAHELGRRRPEKTIDPSEIEELKNDAYTLYESLKTSDIPADLRRYLLDHLYTVIDAIDNYLITGTPGLEIALDSAIGSAYTNYALVMKTKNSDEGKQFWNVFGKLAVAIQFTKNTAELGEKIIGLIAGS